MHGSLLTVEGHSGKRCVPTAWADMVSVAASRNAVWVLWGLPEVTQSFPQLFGVSADQSAPVRFIKTANITLALFACIFVINFLLIVYITVHMGALLWREQSL